MTGIPESFDSFLDSLTPFLLSELRALGYVAPSPERDDLLQEIRIRIWQALRGRKGEINFFNAYVKRVVLSVFINAGRKISRERKVFDPSGCDERRPGKRRQDRVESNDMLKDILADALQSLGRDKRRVVELRFEGFSFAEIAQLNSWSLRKAQSAYYRGIADLRDSLAKRGIHYED